PLHFENPIRIIEWLSCGLGHHRADLRRHGFFDTDTPDSGSLCPYILPSGFFSLRHQTLGGSTNDSRTDTTYVIIQPDIGISQSGDYPRESSNDIRFELPPPGTDWKLRVPARARRLRPREVFDPGSALLNFDNSEKRSLRVVSEVLMYGL